MSCPHTDDVLAHHLDGDPAPPAASHLDECAACRRSLARARRLDAALAEASGRQAQRREPAPEVLRGWLEAAAARARPRPAGARRSRPRAWAGAALFLAGFAAAGLLWARPAGPAPANPAPANPAPGRTAEPVAEARSDGPEPIPLGRGRPVALPRRDPAPSWQTLALLQAPPGTPAAAHWAVEAVRSAAALELLAEGRVSDFCQWLAWERPGLALAMATDRARHNPRLIRSVRARLAAGTPGEDGGLVSVALRLAAPTLDREVRRLLRDRPELVEPAVAALHRCPHRADCGSFLLDLWSDLSARGRLADDEVAGRLLFAGAPRSTAAELVTELGRARKAPRRRRALLALGVCGDGDSLEALLACASGSRFEEAMVAGWAISRQRPEALAPLVPRAAAAGQHVLRAALAGARLPGSTAWVDALELTPEEDAFLRAGDFSPSQFPIAASLFRGRRATGS